MSLQNEKLIMNAPHSGLILTKLHQPPSENSSGIVRVIFTSQTETLSAEVQIKGNWQETELGFLVTQLQGIHEPH